MSLDDFTPDLKRPSTVEQLAEALGIATDIFESIANHKDPEDIYRKHLIPKKVIPKLSQVPVESSSGITILSLGSHDMTHYRVVWEPRELVVKFAHKSAARVLEKYLSNNNKQFPHACAFGYIKGRSTRANARCHVGAKRLLTADIHNFFPSITTGRIELALCQSGINPSIANSFARFLSIENSLPLGLNASPLIANLVAYPLDVDFFALAQKVGCKYSRYADDITFSSMSMLPSRLDVEEVLKKSSFKPNKSKFRESKRGQKHYVTGLSVADSIRPHAPRKMKKRLRQELFFIEKFGFENHFIRLKSLRTEQYEINRLDGTVNYVASIESNVASSLRQRWADICTKEKIERSFEPRPFINLRRAEWFIDEAEITKPDGTKLLVLCLADILDASKLEIALVSLFHEEAGDAFGTNSGLELIRKGLHWVDATWSQREKVVKLLATSPLRAIVAMDKIEHPSEYKDLYIRLLMRLLDTAMRGADDAVVSITVETNSSKVTSQQVLDAVAQVHESLKTGNHRRPLEPPKVVVSSKGQRPAMCVPDVMLGVLGKYAGETVKGEMPIGTLVVSLFERLRNRYVAIFDDHAGQIYYSRNPFQRW